MRNVLSLISGAGPELSLGGLSLMRRPAQHHLGPTAPHGRAQLFTDLTALAVLSNNDGGQGGGGTTTPPAPPVPTPAEIAARAGQQPPTPPTPPASGDPASEDEEKVSLTQRRLNVLMKSEKDEGRRSAYRSIAEAAGIDPDSFDPAKFGEVFKQAEQARQAQLSEEQRRTEEITARERALEAREQAAVQREQEAAQRDRDSRIRAALVRLGATGEDLEDAAALMRVADDADDTAITEAADALKARRGELFGAPATPQTLPPAPSGGPAGGNAPRQPATSSKDAVREAARKRAQQMGLRTDDAA